MSGAWRTMILLGAILIVLGTVFFLFERAGISPGRLPGDLFFTRKNLTIFLPVTSMIVFSIVLTVVLNILFRWMK